MVLCKLGIVYLVTPYNIPEDLNLQWQIPILQLDGYQFAKLRNNFVMYTENILSAVAEERKNHWMWY